MILNAVEWLSVTCIYIVSLPFHVDVSKWYTQPVWPPSSCPQLNVVARIARDIVSFMGHLLSKLSLHSDIIIRSQQSAS